MLFFTLSFECVSCVTLNLRSYTVTPHTFLPLCTVLGTVPGGRPSSSVELMRTVVLLLVSATLDAHAQYSSGSSSKEPFLHTESEDLTKLGANTSITTGVHDNSTVTEGRLLAEVSKPKRKFCNTTTYALKGDYAYEACGLFCKESKAPNHCKFCKCKACSYCAASGKKKVTMDAGSSTSVEQKSAADKRSKKALKSLKKAAKVGKGKGAKKKQKRME